jgi:hypothetical protein
MLSSGSIFHPETTLTRGQMRLPDFSAFWLIELFAATGDQISHIFAE